ncbi:MAG TPA: hypothetical protein VHX16_09550 [Chloroflexota bacterium]|jgi:4-amino-4-deoxy-L-arabinose transferase-like glycosyltransferase|nr:hypothetical protein [Chloroflexota bacterium]
MDAYLFLASLVALAIAAPWLGADSRPGINTREAFFGFYNRQ